MCVGSWAGVTYLRYAVLTSPNKDETAVHCCDPALSVIVVLVSKSLSSSISVVVYCLSFAFMVRFNFVSYSKQLPRAARLCRVSQNIFVLMFSYLQKVTSYLENENLDCTSVVGVCQ